MLGYIVVITRNGSLGGRYPLTNSECLFGQSTTCDVRVYVANVARKHCVISVLPNKPAFIRNLSPTNTTLVNGIPIGANQCQLEHGDLITVGDRHFRWEYPFSSRPGNTPKADRKIDEKSDQRSPACMVQVPLSVFKNKRHSPSGVIKESEITPFTSQDGGEPNPKRRKTLDNITDLAVENTLAKPVNKRLLALTQPASSPKSFNTFRVLLKSASKKKSLMPVSKTPKPTKNVISSKIQRSKSMSFLENKTLKSIQKQNKASSVKKSLSPKKSHTPKNTSKQNKASLSKKSLSPLKNKTPRKTPKHSKSPLSKKSLTPLKNKTPRKTPKHSKSSLSKKSLSPLKNKTPKQSKSPKKSLSPVKTKTPKKTEHLKKSTVKNSLSSLKSKSRDSTPKQSRSPSPQKSKSVLKGNSPKRMISPHTKDKTPLKRKPSLAIPLKSKTPKLSKSSERKNLSSSNISKLSKSASPRKSGNKLSEMRKTKKSKSLPKINTPVVRVTKLKWPISPKLFEKNTPPSDKNTPDKTSRARTPSGNLMTPPSRKSSPAKILFPKQNHKSDPTSKTPPNKQRGRTPNSARVKSSSPKESSPAKSPFPKTSRVSSPTKIKTPTNTPRGRQRKSELKDSSKKAPFSVQSPSSKTPRKSTPIKVITSKITPRGRPPKSPNFSSPLSRKSLSPANSPSPKTSRMSSPIKNKTSAKNRANSPNSSSPAKSPSPKTSRNGSPAIIKTTAKMAREKSPKTERKNSSRKSHSPVQSSPSSTIINNSPVKKQTLAKTPATPSKFSSPPNPPKTSKNISPTTTPAKTQRGGSPKTELKVSSRRSRSSARSLPPNEFQNSFPMKEQTPKITRGRPSSSSLRKSSTSSSASPEPTKPSSRKSRSPTQLQSPNTTQNDSLLQTETSAKTRGRPKKTMSPINSPSSPKTSSPQTSQNSLYTTNEVTAETPRGRPPKNSVSEKKSKSLSPKTSRTSSPIKSPVRDGSKTSEADLSISKSPSQKISRNNSPANGTLNKTLKNQTPAVKESSSRKFSAEFHSTKSSRSPSPVKTTIGRPATLQAVDGKENLEKSLSPAHSPLPKTSRISSLSKLTLILPSVTPDLDVRHTRTSIMRQSLHHDVSHLIAENEDTIIMSDNFARKSALRSRLSSSRSSGISVANLSSTKKADSTKLKSSLKRKQENDFEARAERAAKRLKMETPKSLSKNKVAALLVCHGRSPKSMQKRPLFSEVLKSHLSAAKLRQSVATTSTAVIRKNVKVKPFKPALEVPKFFKFNSTGHANSPETIVITKKIRKTPAPKTRKGRKSESVVIKGAAEQDLEGVSQLFKTPSKAIVSSLKSASSVKKPQSVRVRFSLQNDVQSPSGNRSSVPHAESVGYFGSPVIPSKHYVRTPRPSRFSESSLLHTSIIEESPLAQEIKSPQSTSKGPLRRNSSLGVSNQSFDFSVYSPSSPTLQFSQISGVSSETTRKSIDFSDFSPISETDASPKRKRSMPLLNDSLIQSSSTKRISFASSNCSRSESRGGKLQSSSDENVRLTESYLFGSTVEESNISLVSRASRRTQNDSVNNSGAFQFSPSSSQLSSRSSRSASQLNVSQIPLPPSTSKSRLSGRSAGIKNSSTPEVNDSLRPRRSTRSNSTVSSASETPKTTVSSPNRSKFETLTLSNSKIVFSPKTSPSSSEGGIRSFQSNSGSSENDLPVVFDGSQGSKRVSSTPKLPSKSNNYSPISSPILSSRPQSSVKQSSVNDSSLCVLESLSKTASPVFSDLQFKTPLPTTGRNSRKSSTRMSASNSVLHTPESPVPIAAVKPSTRKRVGSESVLSDADSISLPNLTGSHDVSGRSMDRNFAQRMLESRANSGFDQQTSREYSTSSSGDQSSLPPGSGRRKRKSSASSSTQSLDVTNFDFNSALTPKVPREMFVSPLEKVQDDLTDVAGLKRVLNLKGNSPMSSYLDVKGVKRLLKSPKQGTPVAKYTRVEGIKDLFKHSPVADYSNVVGVKRLYGAPSEPNYMNVKGVRRIFKESNTPNSPDLTGVEVLFESPKKIVEEYNQPSTSRPVVMVSPMSRLNSSSKPPRNSSGDLEELDSETVEVEPVQNFSGTNEMLRQTRNMTLQEVNKNIEDNMPSDNFRKSRRTIAHREVISNKKEENKHLESKPRGRRILKHIDGKVDEDAQNIRRGRSNNNTESQIDKPQTKVLRKAQAVKEHAMETVDEENVEISKIRRGRAAKIKETLNFTMKIDELPSKKKTRAGKEEINQVSDSVEQIVGESSEQKKTRGRRKADNLPEVKQSPDLPKRGRGKRVDEMVLEKPQFSGEISEPKVGRKTRVKLNSSTATSLGKRKLVINPVDDELVNHIPPKRGRKGKQQLKVPQDASSSQEFVKQTIPESLGTSRRGRSRKGPTVSDLPTEIQSQFHLEDEPTTSARFRGNKSKTVPKSPGKEKKQSSPRPTSRSTRGQVKNYLPESIVKSSVNNETKSPLKSKTKSLKSQVENKRETSHVSDEVKSTSSSKKDELNKAVSKSLENTTNQQPSRSTSRGRRGTPVEIIETPSQEENKSNEETVGGSNKYVNPKRTAKLNETIAEGTGKETETTARSRTRRGKTEKSQESPQEKTKKKGKVAKKEDNLVENDHTAELNQRLKENITAEKPLTSQRQSRNKSECHPVAAKTSKRVKFNMCDRVYSITPAITRELRSRSICVTPQTTNDTPKKKATKVVAVKKNIGSKGKHAAKRKSHSPGKSPVAKRVTRARK